MNDRVGVRELRQNLSAYLDRVRAGERLVVTERNVPVAELVPLSAQTPGLARLVAAGTVVPPEQRLELAPVAIEGAISVSAALAEIRGERP